MSESDNLQYTPNRIFLLDHAGNLSTDDSEPIERHVVAFSASGSRAELMDRRRIVLGSVFVVLAAIVIGWMGWKQGRQSGVLFAIHGPSMAPTLLGEHQIAACHVCGIEWPIAISGHDAPVVCFHCGGQAKVASGAHVASVVVVRPHESQSAALSTSTALRSGDVVAIGGEDMLRIKRIAAVPGDVVELNGSDLLVNGEPIPQSFRPEAKLSIPASFMVFEMDSRRAVSRWKSGGWQRSSQRSWESVGREWLVYHHLSIHQRNQSSCIWDDYPYNVGLSRKLQPASRLVLSGKAVCQDRASLEAVFWVDGRVVGVTYEVVGKCEFNISSDDATVAEVASVASDTPVAIRVREGNVQLSCLQLARQVEYRLRPHDDHSRYPIELGSDEYFVLGDNVPASLDSRDFGVIPAREIKGRVGLVGSP